MAVHSPINMRTYHLQFDKAIAKLKMSMTEVLKKTAEGTMRDIVEGPPNPYKTGSYIASHRIGINEMDTSDTVVKEVGTMSIGEAKSRALSEIKKLDSVKEGDSIYISNSVGYSTKYGYSWARNVEYKGWDSESGHTEAHLVYEQAIAKIPQKIKKYISQVISTTGDN